MISSKWKIFVGILFVVSSSRSQDFCEDHDYVGMLQEIRGFSRGGFSMVLNSEGLEEILKSRPRQRVFFNRKTIMVTKEELNFTTALKNLSGIGTVNWAVFVKSVNEFNNSYIPLNSNFFTLQCKSGVIIINRLHHIKPGFPITVKTVGKLLEGGTKEHFKVDRNSDISFGNATLNFLRLSNEEECASRKHVLHKIECFHQEIVKIISERLHFRMNKIQCPETSHPYNYPNGTLSDMYLLLESGKADLSSGSYVVSKRRLLNFDFAWPVFTTRSLMYIKYESVKNMWLVYLTPVERKVWKTTVFWILITGILLQFFEESRRRHFQFRLSLVPEFIKSVFLSLQVFCNQGVHNIPQWYSNRIVFTLNFVLCVALYESYCAVLISSLTVTTPNIPFTDLDEFLSDGTYKMMTLEKGFHNYYIRTTLQEYGQKGLDLLHDEFDLPNTTQGGILKLCTDEKITYVEFRENIVGDEIPCKILELPHPILRQTIGLGLPKHSPYREILNQHITQLRASGILNRMKKYLLSYVTLQPREVSNEEYIHVSLWHLASLFLIIGFGIILSTIIFFLEICSTFSCNRKISCEAVDKSTLKGKHLKRKCVYFVELQKKQVEGSRRQNNITPAPAFCSFLP